VPPFELLYKKNVKHRVGFNINTYTDLYRCNHRLLVSELPNPMDDDECVFRRSVAILLGFLGYVVRTEIRRVGWWVGFDVIRTHDQTSDVQTPLESFSDGQSGRIYLNPPNTNPPAPQT
jgi:hypothetical protein